MHLRSVLRANAAFSAIAGLTAIATAPTLTSIFGLPARWIVGVIGVALLAYAAQVWLLAGWARLRRPYVLPVVLADAGWVLGTLLLLAIPGIIPVEGKLLLGSIGTVVAAFTVVEARAFKKEVS